MRLPWLRSWRRLAGALCATGLGFYALVPVIRFDDPLSTVVLDRHGELLGASIAADGQWRFGPAETVPPRFIEAITCFEDRRFFRHPGVDPLAILRAAGQNVRGGRVVSGGSTLTMQVVRLARKNHERSVTEKLVQAVLALRLEWSASKDEILGLYAAYAPMGGNTVGLDAAAWRYFGRPADRLSWAETATLAVLPNAPALLHPGRNREALRRKRDRLLDALHARGAIDAMTCALAKEEPLPPAPQRLPEWAPHLVARAGKTIALPSRRQGSPWVRTTLDRDLQVGAAEVVERHHRTLAGGGVHNAAALVVEVATGRVVAYVGNVADSGDDHGRHVDVVPATRSTGSILKPLLYSAMLDCGEVLPRQLVPDVPSHFGVFHPENFDRTYAGAVPARAALARSLNIPAARMLRSYGVERFQAALRDMGLTTLKQPARHYGLALILGGAESSLWEVTGVYAGLARTAAGIGGFHAPTYLAGAVPEAAPASPVSAAAAYLTLEAMVEVERPGDDNGWRFFSGARPIAWKTGTSYGFRDAWAVGVTPDYAVGVWAGNADGEGRPGLTGYHAAAPILFDLFGLLPASPGFAVPSGLRDIDVCAQSGMRAGRFCRATRSELVPSAALGAPPCSFCRLVHTEASGRWQVHGDCEPVAAIRSAAWFVLPPAMEVHYARRHADYRPPPPLRPDCRRDPGVAAAALSCVYPPEGAQVYVPREMDGGGGRVVFEAAHREAEAPVFWHIDGEYYGETRDIHELAVAPAPGRHVLTLVDAAGEEIRRTFTVIGRDGVANRVKGY